MTAVVFDIICLVIIALTIIVFVWKGFLSAILSLAGTLAAALVAFFIGRAVAVPLFEAFLRGPLVDRTASSIETYGAYTLQDLLSSATALPETIRNSILQAFGDKFSFDPASLATSVVDEVVAPMLIPVIAIGMFILLFILFRVLISVLTKLIRGANRVPVLGTANRVFGGIAGLLIGLIYVFIIVMIVQVFTLIYNGNSILESAEGLMNMNGIIASFMDGSADASMDSYVGGYSGPLTGVFNDSFFYKLFTGISFL